MLKITKNKIIAAVAIVVVLSIAFFWGGGFAKSNPSCNIENKTDIVASQDIGTDGETTKEDTLSAEDSEVVNSSEDTNAENVEAGEADNPSKNTNVETKVPEENPDYVSKKLDENDVAYSEAHGMEIDSETGKDKYLTDPVPEGKPLPVEPQDMVILKNEKTCTLSIECKTILDNIEDLDKEKVELVPEDGIIMPATTVTFYEGESVFNLLLRETKKNKIHMEFSNTPIYNSAYIEGIHNLYEFDCGELSGWMYTVNGWYPNYGCSRYQMKQGDVIEWIYTCNLGRDIGGEFYEE